jgi:integrase/recombinase XerD
VGKLNAVDLLNNYIELKLKKKSSNTVDAYISDLNQFFSFISKNFDCIEQQDIDDYISHLLSRNLKPKTINRKLISIKQFIEYLNNCSDYGRKICLEVEVLKVQRQEYLEEVITQNDFERLVRLAEREKDFRALAIFYTLYLTGLRVSELITLKVADKDKKAITVLGKGEKYRDILIPERLVEYLNLYIKERKHKPTDYLFLNELRNTPMSRQSVHNVIKLYAGMSKIKLSRAHAHNFRHLYCLRLAEEGLTIDEIADLAGHANINTTRIYTRKTKQDLINVIRKL